MRNPSPLIDNIDEIFKFFDKLDKTWTTLGAATRGKVPTYPPYNLTKKDDSYFIEVACAGFKKSELDVQQSDNVLKISGTRQKEEPDDIVNNTEIRVIHNGLAQRDFALDLQIPSGTEVSSIVYRDGMLNVHLTKPKVTKTQKHEIHDTEPTGSRKRENLKG